MLGKLGVPLEAVRQQVEEIIGQGPQEPTGFIPFSPRAKKVLELSLRFLPRRGRVRMMGAVMAGMTKR